MIHVTIINDKITHELTRKYNQLENLLDDVEFTDDGKILMPESVAYNISLIESQIEILLEMRRLGKELK